MMALPDSRKSPLWDCVAWFVCLCLLYLYRRRQQVQLWIHTQWIALEDVLRIEMSKVMGQELRAVVTVEKLELRATGVAMHRLVMEDAECAAYIESLNFETSGILSLVSLGGIHWMGSARLPFGMGFTVRDVDAIVMTGVKVHVMHKELMELRNLAREKIVMESERRRETRRRRSATRPNIVSSMLRTKLIIHERNKAMVGIKQRARSDFAHEFIRRWGPLDDDALQSVLFTTKMTYPDASWRIGSFEIVNMMVSLYGNQMHLNSYKTCGFVGDTDALSTHLGMNVLQEMIGPRHAMKQVRGEFVNGSRQIMKDISTFTSSVAREIRALNVRKHIVKTFCKSPAKKGRYKAARSSSTLDERHDVKEATVKMEQDRHEAEVDSCGECKVEPPNANSSDARL